MDRQGEPALPASIRAAWGLRDRRARGPKPALGLDRIVQAAVRVAGAEGLGSVSMARIAQELGASTMSLYRYVAAKDELLALMVDAALGPAVVPSRDEDWRSALAGWSRGFHDRLREHRWAVRVPITGLPITPNLVGWVEAGLQALRDTPLSEDEKASVVLLLSGYVRTSAAMGSELEAAGAISDAVMSGYAQLMATVADPVRFPAFRALLAAGVFDTADDPEKEFSFGLERILDGIEALTRRDETEPPP